MNHGYPALGINKHTKPVRKIRRKWDGLKSWVINRSEAWVSERKQEERNAYRSA